MKLPLFLKKYFWDVDFKNLDFKKRQDYVISRLLEYGDIKAARWLLQNNAKKEIKKILVKHRGFTPQSIYFWSLFFNIDIKKILCLKKSYQKMQNSHWLY